MTVNVTDTVGANNTIVLDSNSKIPAIDGSQVTALSATAFTTGSFATARIDVGTTAGKILQLDSNAKIPAISGANLTNAPGPTQSTSDPTISSNLTLGTKWVNKTSGEVYICTDATAGENVWTNVGAGSGDIKPWFFGGESYGFAMGRHPEENATNRFSFASGAQNGVDWGNTVGTNRYNKSGHSDKDNGYAFNCGGAGPAINEIIRFSMTSSSTSNDVGDLTQTANNAASFGNATHGWIAGNAVNDTTRVEKFAFASTGNATDWSDLGWVSAGGGGATNGAGTYGYVQSGGGSPNYQTRIQKVNLTSSATSTTSGVVTVGRNSGGGTSSSTHGYLAGGHTGATSNVIDKFAFATDSDSTDVGNTTLSIHSRGGSSSTTYGYSLGGTGNLNVIEKHSFTTDGNATDVGDLSEGFEHPAGHQY